MSTLSLMLVSVAERTREIGIRKAIGARRSLIMMQFLIEACVLSILGGLIGLGFSALGLRIFAMVADMTITMEWRGGWRTRVLHDDRRCLRQLSRRKGKQDDPD